MGQDLAVDSAPIGTATAGPHAERLSKLVTAQRASVDRDTGLDLYRDMTLGRRFEDKCAEMYYRGKMFGFVHLYNGQEAVSTGVIGAMKRQHDWFCSTYRDHVHALSAGVPAREVMSELFGKETVAARVVAAQCTCSQRNITFLAALPSLPRAFPWHSDQPSPAATSATPSVMPPATP